MNKFGTFLIFLAILMSIGVFLMVVNPVKIIGQKQDKIRVSDLKKIAHALDMYYRDYGRYPAYVPGSYTITVEDSKKPWGSEWMPYIEALPKDPSMNKQYAYWSDSDNNFQSYKVYASLADPTIQPGSCGIKGCPNIPAKNMCGKDEVCNFAVTSGNVSP